MTPASLALFVLILPLASAALIAFFLRRRGAAAAALSVAAAAGIAAGAFILALRGWRFDASREWLSLGGFTFSIGFKFDDLAALMLVIVGIVGLCVHVFSLGYMSGDACRGRYFGGLSIFMFSMIGIVLADNLFMMFIFWEFVGFSSWLLINHWHERPAAAAASKKAFITNRVGDFGFLLGIIMCYWARGTVNLSDLAVQVSSGHAIFSRAIPLLLFCGAIGKSAQLPLQVWLPDAMEGPTPVSALIHAATMVAAGIYMLCRIQVLMVPEALTVIMWVGVATALYAALCAFTQRDIKKVLAYSTISQLGYMVAAFGLGSARGINDQGEIVVVAAGVGAAMFHLTTHAFFKALLFLGSGSVIHGCHNEQDIFKMGGLASRMKLTFVTFTVGVAAIIGLPGLAGFFFQGRDSLSRLREQPRGLRRPGLYRRAHGGLHAAPLADHLFRRAAQRGGGPRPRGRLDAGRAACGPGRAGDRGRIPRPLSARLCRRPQPGPRSLRIARTPVILLTSLGILLAGGAGALAPCTAAQVLLRPAAGNADFGREATLKFPALFGGAGRPPAVV